MIRKTHATKKPRKQGGGWLLCSPKKWGLTSTTYATCRNCIKIMAARGWPLTKKQKESMTTKTANKNIVLKINADGDDLLFSCMDNSRTTRYGMGTFLENLKKGEVEITEAGKQALKRCVYRSGMMGLEIFDVPKVVSWFGGAAAVRVPIEHCSCNAAGRKWLLSLV